MVWLYSVELSGKRDKVCTLNFITSKVVVIAAVLLVHGCINLLGGPRVKISYWAPIAQCVQCVHHSFAGI